MKIFYTILLFSISFFCFSQNFPWNAKFIISYPLNPAIADTVWFGCDTAGADGYQVGLDIIDTAFNDSLEFLALTQKFHSN